MKNSSTDYTIGPVKVGDYKIDGLLDDRHGNTFGSTELTDENTGEKRTIGWCTISLAPVIKEGSLSALAQKNIVKMVNSSDHPNLFNELKRLYEVGKGEADLLGLVMEDMEVAIVDLKVPAYVMLRDKDGNLKIALHPKTKKPNFRTEIQVVRFPNESKSMKRLAIRAIQQIADQKQYGGGFVRQETVETDEFVDNVGGSSKTNQTNTCNTLEDEIL